jgi:septal ring factor EnvC (AmiA/AmiB activator)
VSRTRQRRGTLARAQTAWLLGAALLGAALPSSASREQDLTVVRRAIEDSRERVASYEREQRGVLEALEAIERSAQILEREVALVTRDAAQARKEHASLEAEAAEHARKLEATRRALSKRAVALYRAGELGSLQLLFSADGIREFLARVQLLRRLVGRDAQLLASHRAAVEGLAQAREAARDASDRLALLSRELAQRSRELDAEQQARRSIVSRLHADRARERAALAELETAARALESTLSGLGAGESDAGAAPAGPPFVALRHRLDPPVDAPIARGFGRVVDSEFRTQTFRSGVVFEAAAGLPVRAVAAGRVRFAGWFRGYGRLVILDHGSGYYTVSGHLGELGVGVGDPIERGAQIGTVGDSGSLSGPRLYFEIRRGAEALDPTEWLSELRRG